MQPMPSKCLRLTVQHLVCIGGLVFVRMCLSVGIHVNNKPVNMSVALNEIIPSTLTRRKVAVQTLLTHCYIIPWLVISKWEFFFLVCIYFIVDWILRVFGDCFVPPLLPACLSIAFDNAISLQIDLAVRPLFSYHTKFYRWSLINTPMHTHSYPSIRHGKKLQQQQQTEKLEPAMLLPFIVGCTVVTVVRQRNALSIFGNIENPDKWFSYEYI